MSAFDRLDARMLSALDDLASPQFPDYFDDVLAEATARGQRPAWTFPERWIPVSTLARRPTFAPAMPWRTIGIALLLLALLVAGTIISFGLRSDPLPAPFGPAANGLIAYPADGDIYTRDLVTGEERLVVGGPETDFAATFSRDGQWIAFGRLQPDDPDAATLMVARYDGSDVRTLTGVLEPHSYSWSPTSDALALIAKYPGEKKSLWIVSIDPNVDPTRLFLSVIPEDTVEWRPPGDEIIFRGLDHTERAIYGVHADGTGFRQISDVGEQDDFWGPYDFTPDGNLMLYTDGDPAVTLSVLDLRTGESRAFGAALPEPDGWDGRQQYSGSASVLADGDTIIFGRYWNDDGTRINHQLWSASIARDGAGAVAIGEVHWSLGGHNPFWLAVAPDGQSVFVVENDTRKAWLADPDDGSLEPIVIRTLNDPPTWQRVAPED